MPSFFFNPLQLLDDNVPNTFDCTGPKEPYIELSVLTSLPNMLGPFLPFVSISADIQFVVAFVSGLLSIVDQLYVRAVSNAEHAGEYNKIIGVPSAVTIPIVVVDFVSGAIAFNLSPVVNLLTSVS